MSKETVLRGNILKSSIIAPTLTPAAVSGTQATQTFTIPGLNLNDFVNVTFNGAQTTGISIVNSFVSAQNVISIQFANATGSSATPASGTYLIGIDSADGPLPANPV